MKIFINILTIFISVFIFSDGRLHAAENFTMPSDGYVKWIYKSNGGNHNGIDIWSTSSGGWINDVYGQSNPIYAVYPGEVKQFSYAYPKAAVYVKHTNTLTTIYWHTRNFQVNLYDNVDSNSLLGYQDNDVTVHVHLTVSNTGQDIGHTDPSPYFNRQFNAHNPSPVTGVLIKRPSTECESVDVSLSHTNINSALDCTAESSITILPETNVQPINNNVVFRIL